MVYGLVRAKPPKRLLKKCKMHGCVLIPGFEWHARRQGKSINLSDINSMYNCMPKLNGLALLLLYPVELPAGTHVASRWQSLYAQDKEVNYMPEFDGTGPRGMGPMSGGARGFCILRHPDKPGEGVIGYAGYAGRPIEQGPAAGHRLAALQRQAREIEDCLDALNRRIRTLEAIRHHLSADSWK